ncbi:hypothetical protein [Dysgonomonas macrotermitis]|uniref:Uncharacterized protein n=1 Tax=Dysgonomonas macrotermitis TaxID=1346286 RepID=A0A1M4YID8_9BACT|nr:hypothetical protein [Dysgonomonas macrotermitis]SHF05388.1 hypothetical protein SAMN05444362_103178 [Dysgonomonas macrotermitis]
MKLYLKILSLVSIFMITIFTSCHKSDNQILKEVNEIVKMKPDSTLILLSMIENPSQLEGKDKADYWRIRSRAHYQMHNAMTTDSLILYSVDYYQYNQDTSNLIESYLLLGEYYRWINQPDSTNSVLNKGLEIVKSREDSIYISQFLYKIGINELSRGKSQEAINYFKRRISFDKKSHNSYYLAGIYSNDDSTQYYLDESVRLALQIGDTLSAAHYLRNYASIFLKNKDYSNAIKLIEKTGELSDFYKDFGANHQLMTQIFIVTERLDSAQYYLDKAKNEYRKSSFGSYSDLNLIGNQNALYVLQAIIDTKHNKEVDLAPMYRFNDSIISETNRKNEILLEQITERNNLEQQNLRLLINRQQTHILLIIIFSFVIFLSIIAYLYTQKKKRKLQEITERAESLQILFREALNVKDEKQNNSQLFRKTLLQQLGIIKLVATTPAKQNKGLLHQIIDISNESVSTESLLKWNDLYSIIDSIYDNFHTKLKEKYGNILIEKEIQLCCLLRADFSTVEISAIMQQSMQTIYQRKSTIRGKLKMEDKEDILPFLEEQF